jgi:tripartite-type tricarboxylate transporter receptor subunit TctC
MNRWIRPLSSIALVALVFAPLPVISATAPSDYPVRNIRMVVPFAPGGPIEVVGRLIGQRLADVWGHAIVVDNRPGASGLIGADVVAKSPRDGYTLLITAQSQTINPSMYKRLPYDTVRDFAPITQVARGYGLVLIGRRTAPFNSVKELIALAKAQPGKFTFGSSGVGNSTYLAPALMMSLAGIELLHVPYKGIALATNDVIGGQIDMAFVSAVLAAPLVKSGRVRGLGIGGSQRLPSLPEMPTLQEEGLAEFDLTSWYGMWFPSGTPRDRILRMHAEIARIQATPEMKQRFEDIGLIALATHPDEFGKFVEQQIAYYARVAKQARVEPQ